MSDIPMFLLIGAICLVFNKPIAQEIGGLYLFPVRWLFGEKKWVMTTQHYFMLWARATLYFGVLISIIVIILELNFSE
jgi:hypothetical protein